MKNDHQKVYRDFYTGIVWAVSETTDNVGIEQTDMLFEKYINELENAVRILKWIRDKYLDGSEGILNMEISELNKMVKSFVNED